MKSLKMSRERLTGITLLALMLMSLVLPAIAMGAGYTVSIRRAAASVYTGQKVKISGTVAPNPGGGKHVVVQYKKSNSLWWKSVTVRTSNTGGYKYYFASRNTGHYDIRAKYTRNTRRYYSSKIRIAVKARTKVVLASTTSTQDSGLFNTIIPAFETRYPKYDIHVVAVGSGQAITLGKNKDADVLLVHSPADELAFVAGGWGFNRRPVMHNDFKLVGPTTDPAGLGSVGNVADCFKKIYNEGVTFVSRGDGSGTHKKELAVWKSAGYAGYPSGKSWYVVANGGMGETIRMAGEKSGYTLVDLGSWVTNRPSGMKVMQQGDDVLRNPYNVIQVNGARQLTGAATFSNWIVGSQAQQLIYNFGYAKYRQHLFWPDAD